MKKERNIGQEILDGLEEIKKWQTENKKLKITHIFLPNFDGLEKKSPGNFIE